MILHQLVMHCDYSPIPNKCEATVVIVTSHENDDILVRLAMKARDWGEQNGKHYCPVHRPPPP